MRLSEKEAKEKYCPEMVSNPEAFKPGEESLDLSCLASGCMAWRWAKNEEEGIESRENGYCGLAGKP